jgi:hypothetical protein
MGQSIPECLHGLQALLLGHLTDFGVIHIGPLFGSVGAGCKYIVIGVILPPYPNPWAVCSRHGQPTTYM